MKHAFILIILIFTILSCVNQTQDITPVPPSAHCGDTPTVYSGQATYYTFANGSGNCCFDSTPNDLMVGAMNHAQYIGAFLCGACAQITGPDSTITIRVVDQCPECPFGNIDLSPLAFGKIADLQRGIVPITWHVIGCNVSGPIIYHFKDGSNQWWTAVQVRNHRYIVVKFEFLNNDSVFVAVPRTDYNYFVKQDGMGPGPYTFRVTDYYGDVIVDTGIVPVENSDVPGTAQFPLCQ
jgi:expansin